MSWTRYLKHDLWTAKEFNDMEAQMRRRATAERRSRADVRDSIEDLEAELGFLALMNRAMLQVLLDHGLCDKNRITQLMRHFDTLDGEADGGLDAAALAGDLGLAPKPQPDPAAPAADAAKKLKRRKRRKR